MGTTQDVMHGGRMGRADQMDDQPLERGSSAVNDAAPDREYDWTTYAALSGIVGAFVVAVVFLAIDLLSGRAPLWTPAVLGAALFLGESVGTEVGFDPMRLTPVIVGYTVMHGAVFIGFGAMAASARLTRERAQHFGLRVGLAMALLIFLGLQLTFAILGWVTGPEFDPARRLDRGWVVLANALAACAMTITLAAAARRLNRGPESDDSA